MIRSFALSDDRVVRMGLVFSEELTQNVNPRNLESDCTHFEAKYFEIEIGLLSRLDGLVVAGVEFVLTMRGEVPRKG